VISLARAWVPTQQQVMEGMDEDELLSSPPQLVNELILAL